MPDRLGSSGGVPLSFLAPMAGVTNSVFRRLCKDLGADVLTTEFVSAEGILQRNQRTKKYLEFDPSERPLGIQLFGADPGHLAEAARAVIGWVAPDFIDLNFGCPVNKVVCRNGGSALLRDIPLLAEVARAVVAACGETPVTAKARIGWSRSAVNAVEVARALESEGIRRLTVHGRTKDQGYSGSADWGVIGEVVASVSIPIIGNGDITSGAVAARRVRETGVAGVMVGRAAMSNPWIFSEIQAALSGGECLRVVSLEEKWAFIVQHCRKEIAWWDGREDLAMRAMRSRLMAYTRGMPGGAKLRQSLQRLVALQELETIAGEYVGRAVGDGRVPAPSN